MPIRVFSFSEGKLIEKTSSFGFANTEGLWNCLLVEDINGDGKPDLVLQNTVTGDRYIWTMNGTTWLDRTNYFETVPANRLELALWLESDRMGFLLGAAVPFLAVPIRIGVNACRRIEQVWHLGHDGHGATRALDLE